MSQWDKSLIVEAFDKPVEKNNECIILVATDAYGIGIDNLDIKLVNQWDISLLFDSIIQQIERARRKSEISAFILFTPK